MCILNVSHTRLLCAPSKVAVWENGEKRVVGARLEWWIVKACGNLGGFESWRVDSGSRRGQVWVMKGCGEWGRFERRRGGGGQVWVMGRHNASLAHARVWCDAYSVYRLVTMQTQFQEGLLNKSQQKERWTAAFLCTVQSMCVPLETQRETPNDHQTTHKISFQMHIPSRNS